MVASIPLHNPCPHCGRPNDSVAGDGQPQPGDTSICFGCSQVSVFAGGAIGLHLRLPTPEEQEVLANDAILQLARHRAAVKLLTPLELAAYTMRLQ